MKKFTIKSLSFLIIVIFCTLFSTFVYAEIPKDALIGAWIFEEGSGKVVKDISGNGNDMTIADGAPKWVDGKMGKAMQFDGVADFLAAPDSPSFDSINGAAVSIVCWVNGTDFAAAARHVLRKVHDTAQASVYILRCQNNVLTLYLGTDANANATGTGATQLKTGEWIHLAMVYDGVEVRGYVNGELDATIPVTGKVVTSDQELRIARGDPAGYFTGIIDEVGLFRASLTQDQIKEIMNKGLATVSAVDLKNKLAIVWGAVKYPI